MHFDPLESRRLFAITTTLDAAGTLTVQGDAADDVITVQDGYRSVTVSQSSADTTWTPARATLTLSTGPFVVADPLTLKVWTPSFPLSSVARIVVRGGGGKDTIVINSSIPADVRGEAGPDVIYGGFSNDTIDGGDSYDTLDGRAGNDVLNGGDGNNPWGGWGDQVRGGDGDDLFIADAGEDHYSGGAGRDHLSYANHGSPIAIDAGWGSANFDFIYPLYEDMFDAADIEVFTGTAGDDYITGDARDNVFYGGDGNDNLWGFGGNDTLYGQGGADTLYGDDGGGGADPAYFGTPGNDMLDGGSGSDHLYGDDGNDVLYARDGQADWLDGGNGFDTATFDSRTWFGWVFLDGVSNVEVWA